MKVKPTKKRKQKPTKKGNKIPTWGAVNESVGMIFGEKT